MALQITNDTLFAVVDVEATGLNTTDDRVVSVAVQIQNAAGDILQTWDTLVNPGIPMTATDVHGLTDADVAGAPAFAEVAPHLAELFKGRIFVAHNAGYDAEILRSEFQRASQEAAPLAVLCTVDLARRNLQLAANNLAALAEFFRIEQHQAHEAKDDTRVLGRILPHLLQYTWQDRLQAWNEARRNQRNSHTWKLPPVVEILPCPWVNPGTWNPGMELMAGMRVALTGGTDQERIEGTVQAQKMGLGIASSVSKTTSLVVTDDVNSKTGKAKKARGLGTSMVSYAEFMLLLENVLPGTPA